jgi:hypothetical protein
VSLTELRWVSVSVSASAWAEWLPAWWRASCVVSSELWSVAWMWVSARAYEKTASARPTWAARSSWCGTV